MFKKKYTKILLNPRKYLQNEKLICEFINKVTQISDEKIQMLSDDDKQLINLKYTGTNNKCRISNYNNLLSQVINPHKKDNNIEALNNVINRYIDIVI
jgi:hypothetical protein